MYIHLYVYMCVYIRVYVCMLFCVCMCMCVCMCVHISILHSILLNTQLTPPGLLPLPTSLLFPIYRTPPPTNLYPPPASILYPPLAFILQHTEAHLLHLHRESLLTLPGIIPNSLMTLREYSRGYGETTNLTVVYVHSQILILYSVP